MGTIVVGVDGSECSHDALRWAVEEASRRQAALEAVFALTFPYVVPVAGHLADDAKWLERADKKLDGLLRTELGGRSDVEVTRRVEEGPAARALLDAAKGADMLVVGSRGRGGFAGLVLGSVSQQCVQHAGCPVVVVRREHLPADAPPKEEAMERIVVGVDGSENARAALHWALDEACLRNAAVDVVYAWHMPYLDGYPYGVVDVHPGEFERDARQLLDKIVGGVDSTGVPAVEPILICDGAARALLDTAKGADLLVVGSRGRGGFTGLLLGSVSQQVVHHAPCPVVVIPPLN
jgi:nucleotide-binding universal stress UspA family protein